MLRLLRTPATIPVLNYHKPLTPARTKLFLHSDSKQLIITVLFDIEYSVYLLHILKLSALGTRDSFEIHSKNHVKPVPRKKYVINKDYMCRSVNLYIIRV